MGYGSIEQNTVVAVGIESSKLELLQSLADKMRAKRLAQNKNKMEEKKIKEEIKDTPESIKIQSEISILDREIAQIRNDLQYADYGSYGQDIRIIEGLQAKRYLLQYQLQNLE